MILSHTDLRISVSEVKFDAAADFEVRHEALLAKNNLFKYQTFANKHFCRKSSRFVQVHALFKSTLEQS